MGDQRRHFSFLKSRIFRIVTSPLPCPTHNPKWGQDSIVVAIVWGPEEESRKGLGENKRTFSKGEDKNDLFCIIGHPSFGLRTRLSQSGFAILPS